MTDIDIVCDLLERAKIPHGNIRGKAADAADGELRRLVIVEEGYPCFFTEFMFDLDGKLLRVSAWE